MARTVAARIVLCFLSFLAITLARSIPASSTAAVRQLYQFPNTTSIQALENLAIRPNGEFIITLTSSAKLYTLDPSAPSPTLSLLHEFPDQNATVGIVETSPDVFAVAVGTFSSSDRGVKGSFAVWSIDFNRGNPAVTPVATIPEAEALNGMTTATGSYADTVFIADSDLGVVWGLNVSSGEYRIALQSALFQPPETGFPLGINGVHVFEQALYFTNSGTAAFGRFRIDTDGDHLFDDPAILVNFTGGNAPDDFAFDRRGRVFLAVHPNSIVGYDVVSGQQVNVTEESAVELYQPTSVAFGRNEDDCLLYAVTAGEVVDDGVHNGQVLQIDVCKNRPW